MKGNIIGFDADRNTGAISGYDGKRYDFTAFEWHGQNRPRHGDVVDFVPAGERATRIYPLAPEYVPPSFVQFYLSLRGRISRSQYWLRFFLPVFAVGLVLSFLQLAGIHGVRLLPGLFNLLVLWPGIAVLVKRIHDRNKSGALVWALYGPLLLAVFLTVVALAAAAASTAAGAGLGLVAGAAWLVVVGIAVWFFVEFGCLRGTVGPNTHGADPVREN